jgi:hypothetical protein
MYKYILLFILLFVIAIIILLQYSDYKSIKGGVENHISSTFNHEDFQEFFKAVLKLKNLPPMVSFNDIKNRLTYRSKNVLFRPTLHIGQRKLFNNELQFLTNHLDSKESEAIVVYAGSNPSNHIYFLHQLFPKVKFLLVDPNETLIYTEGRISHYENDTKDIIYAKSSTSEKYIPNIDKQITWFNNGDPIRISRNKAQMGEVSHKFLDFMKGSEQYKIFIIEDLFTIQLATLITQSFGPKNVFFWSDIRTNVGNETPKDIDILWNLSQQYNWVKVLNPIKFMLKFRAPFYDQKKEDIERMSEQEPYATDLEKHKSDINLVENYIKHKFIYLGGIVFIQPFAGQTSTESRLVGSLEDKLKEYNINDYDNAFFYYNNIDRPFGLHVNNNADKKLGYDLCGDCSLENHILEEYKSKIDKNFKVKDATKKLEIMTHRDLIRNGHGKLFSSFSIAKYNELKEKYQNIL